MEPTMLPALLDAPRKRFAKASLRGETVSKAFADPETQRQIGRVIERAIALAGLTKDQAGRLMGYEGGSLLARWFSGTENPQFARVWAVVPLRPCLLMALAEQSDDCIEVRTIVTLRRSAVSA